MSSVTALRIPAAPVICDFGWYFGSTSTPQRLSEAHYTVDGNHYPPATTTLAGGANQTLPNASLLVSSTAGLEPSGAVTIYASTTSHTTTPYTVVNGTHLNCTGGAGTFASGTPVYDARFYVDQMPLRQTVIFDAIDAQSLGLPTVQVPGGVSIIYYQWDFGNGQIGFGPYAATTYTYNQPVPSIQTTLTVFDSLGRRFSCAHHLNQQNLSAGFAAVNRVNP